VEYYDDEVDEDSGIQNIITTITTTKITTARTVLARITTIGTDDVEYYDDEEDETAGGNQTPKELSIPDVKSEINIQMSSVYFVMVLMLIN
jgi:hypothetical protein